MRQQDKERLAGWAEALAGTLAQASGTRLYQVGDEVFFADPGNRHGPDLERLSEAVLKAGGWGHKLSSDYVEKAMLEVLLTLLNPSSNVAGSTLLDSLYVSFDGYDEERTVYVPIDGVEMTDVEEVRFGYVVLKKMTDAQREELAKDFETEEDRSRFFDRVRGSLPYAEMTVSAEPIKAWEIAGDRIRSVLDLLRYSVPFLSPTDPDPDINPLGQGRTSFPLVAVHGANVEDLHRSFSDIPTRLELSLKAVEEMSDAGVFEAAGYMTREPNTDLERKVLRSIQWASNSQGQREPQNRLLSLMIALETLLPPPGRTSGGTAAWVSEGAAILLGANLSSRLAVRNRIVGLYRKRNSIVHGGEEEEITMEDFLWLRGTVHDLIKVIIKSRDQFETPDGTYDLARCLQDYKLTPKT